MAKSNQLFGKEVLPISFQSGSILMITRKGLGGMSFWVTRCGLPESTFSPEVKFHSFLSLYLNLYLTSVCIFFFPGDKASRRIRMANDIFFWARDFPYKRSKGIVFLFSDQFKDDAEYTEMLQNLVSVSCYVRSIIPTQDSNKPESPNWPGLLIDGGGGYWVDY